MASIGRVVKTVSVAHWPSVIQKSVSHSKNTKRVYDKFDHYMNYTRFGVLKLDVARLRNGGYSLDVQP